MLANLYADKKKSVGNMLRNSALAHNTTLLEALGGQSCKLMSFIIRTWHADECTLLLPIPLAFRVSASPFRSSAQSAFMRDSNHVGSLSLSLEHVSLHSLVQESPASAKTTSASTKTKDTRAVRAKQTTRQPFHCIRPGRACTQRAIHHEHHRNPAEIECRRRDEIRRSRHSLSAEIYDCMHDCSRGSKRFAWNKL